RFLSEVPALPIAALTLLLPLLLAMLHTRRRPKIAAAATGAVLLALGLLSIALFAWKGIFFPAAAPIAACVLSAALLATRQHAKDYTRAARISTVLSRFVSPTLLEELDSRGTEQKLPPPRRVELTVIFVDIAGFTPFTEESDPEVVSQLLAEVYPMAMEELFRHQGTLDSFKGDGVLAYFGAPKPVEDKELKALKAAIAIRDRFAILDAERIRRGGQPLGIRCGITTGFVSVGYFGGERKGTYGVIGRAVNLAARIQGAGESGQVLLDRLTAKRVEDKAQLREIEPLTLKGIAKPVEVWLAESKTQQQETGP
ncbi:MAG: adenylate/guanylate cyclase domain-containing protein, partial [Elusimicrobiota bacterium]